MWFFCPTASKNVTGVNDIPAKSQNLKCYQHSDGNQNFPLQRTSNQLASPNSPNLGQSRAKLIKRSLGKPKSNIFLHIVERRGVGGEKSCTWSYWYNPQWKNIPDRHNSEPVAQNRLHYHVKFYLEHFLQGHYQQSIWVQCSGQGRCSIIHWILPKFPCLALLSVRIVQVPVIVRDVLYLTAVFNRSDKTS